MASEIVLMVGCWAPIGLFSLIFNLDQGLFRLQESYNYTNISYFAQSDQKYLYATARGVFPEHLIKLQVSSTSSNRANQTSSTNLLKTGAAYLSARSLSGTSTRLAIAHYGSGNVEFADDSGSSISNGPTIQFTYFSKNDSSRQEAPHPHCIIPYDSSTTTDYLVTDLGADRIYMIHLNESAKNITITGYISMDGGAGPRHILRHPNNTELLFVLTELSNELIVYKEIAPKNFTLLQKYTTLNTSSSDNIDNSVTYQNAGHLGISDDGQYIIASNRGIRNNIVVFQLVDATQGTLKVISVAGSGGFHPRYFQLYGGYLIVANRFSNNMVAFKFENGTIEAITDQIYLQEPIAIQVIAKFNTQSNQNANTASIFRYNALLLSLILALMIIL